MAASGVFGVGIQETVADIFHLGGSLIVVLAVISMEEPMRICRYMNILLRLAVAVAPWFLGNSPTELSMTGAVLGLAVAGLALPLGLKTQYYAGWKSTSNSSRMRAADTQRVLSDGEIKTRVREVLYKNMICGRKGGFNYHYTKPSPQRTSLL
ncbi:hypothetical protein DXT99_01350 [Pontibacter diazotrophicus]|uniref:Uncharacterized protein n=1 Tax=Pontibacter diazotrophicus TaxID=1400979 RepID=A0A3D8LIU5_9BACT|nr:hypothetical protein [Pontibacter diazotrophicus]RDV17184.1 hypothetical protein DXT99_01350 [Pontibacter diazotrophicus]